MSKCEVLVTLGAGVDLVIDKERNLTLRLGNQDVLLLGPATHQRLTELQEHIERLKCFTVPIHAHT
jgi:cellobiose-specific phosphotransferase system component IIB